MEPSRSRRIAIKFGMLVIGLEENVVSIDELAQRKSFWHLIGQHPSR